MISYTERQMRQMVELAKIMEENKTSNPLKAEIFANAASETVERITNGTDENFNVKLFLLKQKNIESNKKKPFAVGKGKNEQKEVNIVEVIDEDEAQSGVFINTISTEEPGYSIIEEELSIRQTYHKIVEELTRIGYRKNEFKEIMLRCHQNDESALLTIRMMCSIQQIGEYVREFLGYADSIRFLQTEDGVF